MVYRVKIMPRAGRDLFNIYQWIGADSSEAAFVWYAGLRDAIRSLRSTPGRCAVTPEDRNLRHLLYGNKPHIYRIVYRILENQKQVDVLHIRHGARRAFTSGEF